MISYRVDVPVCILMNPDARLLAQALPGGGGVVEEVEDLLVVELHELRGDLELRDGDAALARLLAPPLHALEQLADGARDDAEARGLGEGGGKEEERWADTNRGIQLALQSLIVK